MTIMTEEEKQESSMRYLKFNASRHEGRISNRIPKGLKPKLIEDGTSGAYQIRNVDKETIAIFKPFDEEAYAPNNQKGYVNSFGSKSFREGILSGEATIREEATYLLDSFYAEKFKFDVPATTFVELCHKTFKINVEEMKIMQKNDYVKRSSIMKLFLYENLRKKKNNIVEDDDIFVSNEKYNRFFRCSI